MASRRDQKEEARAARLAAEQDAAAHAARAKRMQVIGGVVVIAVAVVAVVIGISIGGAKAQSGLLKGDRASATYASIEKLIGGIPQHGETLGDPAAKVTLGYFGDLECPICMEFTAGASVGGTVGGIPQFITDMVRTGQAKLQYRSFCTATCNDYANGQSIFDTQQVAAYAAGRQNLFWNYEELFYHEQGAEGSGYVTPGYLDKLARQIPTLSLGSWQSERKDPSLLSQVQADQAAAQKDGVSGTPTIYVSGPKGFRIVGSGVLGYSQLAAAVRSVS